MEKGVSVFGPRFGARLAGIWLGVPAPLDCSGVGIQRLEQTTDVRGVPGESDDHVVTNHKRRHRREVAKLGISQFDDPANGAILGIQTDQVRIGGSEVEPILVHGQAAMADVVAFGSAMVMPDLASVPGIDSPNVLGHGEVKNAVHFQRSRFNRGSVRVKDPCDCERADISGINLVERAETPARVVSVIGRPGIGCGL